MPHVSVRRNTHRHRFAVQIVSGAVVTACALLVVLAQNVRAAQPRALGVELLATGQIELILDGFEAVGPLSGPPAVLRWRWHFAADGGRRGGPFTTAWEEGDVHPTLRLERPATAALLEVVLEQGVDGRTERQVWTHSFLPEPRAVLPAWSAEEGTLAKAAGDSVVVQGRIVFGDRLFDHVGYTGTRQLLPARAMELQWRTAATDSLVAQTQTDSTGHFEFAVEDPGALGVLWLHTRAVDPVAGPIEVVDAAGMPHALALGSLDLAAATLLEIGTLEVPDGGASSLAGAVHLLDLALDALDLLASGAGPAGWGAAAATVPIRWDPAVPNASTFFDGQLVVVASPASGSSDAWSDGAVLAALGHALLHPLGWPQPTEWDWLDLDRPPARSLARALGWTFAGAVQAWRAEHCVAADGAPLLAPSTLLVDLPSPPPLGFSTSLEAGLELESAELQPGARAVVARGQRGAPGLAALLWDALDDSATVDSDTGVDDDAVAGSTSRWFAAFDLARALHEVPVYEDLHDAWIAAAAPEEAVALTALAVSQTRCAVEIDTFEPDDDPADATLLDLWIQPPLSSTGVRVNEIFLGDRDGVELVNRGDVPVDVGGWTLDARRNGFSNGPQRSVVLPAPKILLPGRQLLVIEGTPQNLGSELDVPAPDWDVPWAPNEDGAVILRDASAIAVDFVRWDGAGGADRSLEPVAVGTSFLGRLVAPDDASSTLARDVLFTDTNQAADFTISTPSPGWPNVDTARVHSLRPRGDTDHLEVAGSGPIEVHARRDRDDGAPRLSLAEGSPDAIGALRSGIGSQARGALATLWPAAGDTHTVLRLDLAAPAATSTGLQIFAWRPASDWGVAPVRDLRATPRGLGTATDSVRIEWSVRGRTDSLRVRLDGLAVRSLAGTDSSVVLAITQGSHVVRVEPFLADRVGAPRDVGVYVGLVPCALQTGFEPADPAVVGTGEGFIIRSGEAFDGVSALRDAPAGANYPDNSQATTTLLLPVDLTGSAELRFAHAVHLVPDGDLARLELSVDEGLSWIELGRWDGAAHPVDASDLANWGDGVLENTDWVQESFDLGAFAGERVRLRWRRDSNASGNSIGWSIDALSLDLGGSAGQYWIGVDGSDVTGCGIEGRPWATLTPALAVVRPGERIVLGPGRHEGTTPAPGAPVPVFAPLPAGVELVGSGSASTVIVAPPGGWGVWSAGVDPDSSLTRIRSLRVEGGSIGLVLERTRVELDSLDVIDADTSAVLRVAPTVARASLFARGDVGLRTEGASLELDRCTVADLGVGVWLAAEGDSLRAFASLLGRATQAIVFTDAPTASASVECSGLWGSLSTFEGPLAVDTLGIRNFDPQHCDPAAGLYTLAESSPYRAQPWCGQVGARGVGCPAPGITDAPEFARALRMSAPHPNPFNPRVRFAWEQPRAERARLEVFDLRGRRVRVLVDEFSTEGRREVVWEGTDAQGHAVASGVYLVQLRVGAESIVQRVALIR